MYVSKQPRIWRGNVCWSQWVTFLCSTVVTWGHRGICSAHKDVCKPLIPSRHALRMTFVLCSLVALRNKVLQRPYTVTLLIRAHRLLYYVATQLFRVQRPFPQVLVKSTAARSLTRHPVVIVLLWLPSVPLGRKNHLDLLLSLLLEFNFNKIFLSFKIGIRDFCI